jgi:23S rRNA pseudouridine1911/1915/1917 synthase
VNGSEDIAVADADSKQRLDRYLTTQAKWGTRSQVRRLIAEGCVRLDGRPAKAGALLRAGQVISISGRPRLVPEGVVAEPIPLDVLYEDRWLLVINKRAGLVVHPAPGHWSGTLVSALLYRWQGAPAGLDPLRPGVVHRLDKDTSGVLVIAKDPETLADLAAQFKDREVEKQYLALVWGRPQPPRGTIDEPIGRNPVHRKRMAVRRAGRAAQTRYEVVDSADGLTLLRLWPRTGRTHQLRVHLACIGHPIVGDAVYGRGRKRASGVPVSRQALHAEQLSFRHPQSGERLRFRAPLPPDLAALPVAAKALA